MRDLWGTRAEQLSFIPLEHVVDDATTEYQARAAVMAMMVAFCLPIMGLGVHGSAAAEAKRLGQTMAIELALGATPRLIQRRLQARIVGVAAAGIVLGLACGFGVGTAVASRVYGVTAIEPSAAVLVTGLTLGLAWWGSKSPAKMLAKTDPAIVLRRL
jgi:putative ABC transport system permease protein